MRILWTLLICLLTLYAPAELTRVIFVDLERVSTYWGIPVWQFMLEIALFWIMYLVGMTLVYKRIKWLISH